MAGAHTCPKCGSEKPVQSPGGLCPVCMLREGQESGSAYRSRGSNGVTINVPSSPGSVLDSIAATFGSVPRVLLCDTSVGETPSPIVRPGLSRARMNIHRSARRSRRVVPVGDGTMSCMPTGSTSSDADTGIHSSGESTGTMPLKPAAVTPTMV